MGTAAMRKESNMVCQEKHWKVVGDRVECAALAAAAAVPVVGEGTGSNGAGIAEGKGDESDDVTSMRPVTSPPVVGEGTESDGAGMAVRETRSMTRHRSVCGEW